MSNVFRPGGFPAGFYSPSVLMVGQCCGTNSSQAQQAIQNMQQQGGGLLYFPDGTYNANTALPANYAGVLLELQGPNMPMAFGTSPAGTLLVTQLAWLHQDAGNHVGNIHSALHIGSSPVGSGNSGPTNSDVALTISHVRQNVTTTTVAGEMDSLYFQTVNGGPNSDTSCIEANATNYGTGFTCFAEVATSIIVGNTITENIDVQIAVCDSRAGAQYGLVLNAGIGTLTCALLIQSSVPATSVWTTALQVNRGTAQQFTLDGLGQITMAPNSGLGGNTMTVRNRAGILCVVNNAQTAEVMTVDQTGNIVAASLTLSGSLVVPGGATASIGNQVWQGSTSTGAETPVLGANKPGTTTGSVPNGWMSLKVGGVQNWVPYWIN